MLNSIFQEYSPLHLSDLVTVVRLVSLTCLRFSVAKRRESAGMQMTLHPLHIVSEAHPPEEIFQKPQPPAPKHEDSSALARPLSRTLSGTGSEGGSSDVESPSRYVHMLVHWLTLGCVVLAAQCPPSGVIFTGQG